MGDFIFISFVQPQSFCGDFSFSWRGMTLYSASCSVVNVCRLFAQIYAALCMFYSFFVSLCAFVCGFCARCVAFSYVYDFFVCMLYGFYVRIRLLCALSGFCVRIRLIFCARCVNFAYVYGLSSECSNADSLEGSNLEGSLIYFICANALDSWQVSRNPILRVP